MCYKFCYCKLTQIIIIIITQVKILRDDARVRLANQVNLTEAVRVALLTLPEKFSESELFERIAGISYTGDFRMIVGENPNKIQNIVQAQLAHFDRLYFGLLDDLPNVASLSNGQYQVKKNTILLYYYCGNNFA